MIDYSLIHQMVAAAMRPGVALADLFAERTTFAACSVRDGEIVEVTSSRRQGAGLRQVRAGATRYAHTPSWSAAGLRSLVGALDSGAAPAELPRDEGAPADEPPLAAMIVVARDTTGAVAGTDGERLSIKATVRVLYQEVLIGNSDGQVVEGRRAYAKLSIEAIARRERQVRIGQRQLGASTVADLCAGDAHLRLARETAEVALAMLEAAPAPTGALPVILGPGGPATLFHEACGHALEADLAHHGSSAYHGRLGTLVASPLITLIDDPWAVEGAPVYQFDDEGVAAQPTLLIEQGVLRDYLYDRRNALMHGRRSNGHGRRVNYAYPPLPRMSATYITPGESRPEEIIADTSHGLYVRAISGGDTDMGSGRFNLQVSEGYLIEGGRIGAPIHGALISGLGSEVLLSIDRVGSDSSFMPFCYVCNKLDQFPLAVTVGQPTLRVRRMQVRGG